MNNLKDIHNPHPFHGRGAQVVLSGCQWTIWRIYTTQCDVFLHIRGCFIRMSMNNLKDIHNFSLSTIHTSAVVLSGCQWTIWRIYTTLFWFLSLLIGCFIRMSMNNLKDIHNCGLLCLTQLLLFYQDVNEQFEGYTQPHRRPSLRVWVVLSGCQWTIWRIYTTKWHKTHSTPSCFIRMSMNNLKDIHNWSVGGRRDGAVVLSGCQWTIWRIYTT